MVKKIGQLILKTEKLLFAYPDFTYIKDFLGPPFYLRRNTKLNFTAVVFNIAILSELY